MLNKIILASKSKVRKQILDKNNIKSEVLPSNVNEEIVIKNEIGRIRDIQIHPLNGKLFFLSQNALWLMDKN